MEEIRLRPALHKYAIACICAILLFVLVALAANIFLSADYGLAVAIIASLLGLFVLSKLLRRYYLHISTEYVITDSEITLISGLWMKAENHVPIGKIEDYSIHRSLVGKLLGVASIGIQTARAEAGFEIVLRAIPEKDVMKLDELLEKLVEPEKQ